ncbi:MAG: hypothetical protein F6K26_47765 [Moorea sp. SIO2I5]|nr:hypothetical protein [Moorena sp. SIO2I5]
MKYKFMGFREQRAGTSEQVRRKTKEVKKSCVPDSYANQPIVFIIAIMYRDFVSLLPIPYSLLPTPYSLLPTPYSLFPTPYSLLYNLSLHSMLVLNLAKKSLIFLLPFP